MIRNVVFDFGAVLFQWQPQRLVAEAFPARAAQPDAARALASALFAHADWQAFDAGTLEQDVVVQRSADRLGLPRAELAALVDSIPSQLTPIEVTVQLLERLCERRARDARPRLYFLSNMPRPFARELERRHRFLERFDAGLFSGDVGLAKPDPAIFALAERRLALEPGATVFIDDHLDNVQAARARGWTSIHCLSPQGLALSLDPCLD